METASKKVPSELEILLLPLPEHLHEAMTRVFYEQFEGDPSGTQVQAAMLLSGLVYAAKSNGSHLGPSHSEDIEAARAEITQLAQIVRGMGESCAKLERRFSLVGDSLTKIESRLGALNEVTATFTGVAKSQLWALIAAVFIAGFFFWPFSSMFLSWLRGVLHV